MPLQITRRQALASLSGLLAAGAAPAFAQGPGYPSRPVRLVVGASPGGPSDFMARLLGDGVGPLLGQSFLVENKPGASGTMAAEIVARAPADGHSLLVSGPSAISVARHLFPKLGYDAAADLVPVAMLGAGAFVLVAHPSVPARTAQELIALAKAKPGSLAFGSGGNGSSGHLCAELFASLTGTRMFHVPYKGDGQAMNDLLAGQLQFMFTAPNVAMPQVKAGKLRLLAVTTRERVPGIPDAPTVHESGLPDFEYLGWIAVFAPSGTPRPVIESLAAAWNKVRVTPAVRTRLDELAMAPPDRLVSGEPLARFVTTEDARLGRLIRDAGIKAD